MPKKRQKTSHNPNSSIINPAIICKLCTSDLDDELLYGPKIDTGYGGSVHYFCLLFACGLTQNGEDEEGVFGFLPEDIRKEVLRANKLRCTFCKKNTVASACAVSHCRVKYHFNCGLKNNCLFQFYGCFASYCVKHRPELDKRYSTADPELTCSICLEKLDNTGDQSNAPNLKYQILLTSCCTKFLHINCVKAQAHNAGMHFIKCPLCNDRQTFPQCAKEHGVYLPDQDATWEDPNDPHMIRLSERYLKCDASVCRCAEGRTYCADDSEWEINVCKTCGSFGVHTACSDEPDSEQEDSEFECPECKRMGANEFESAERSEPAVNRSTVSESTPIRTSEPTIREAPAIRPNDSSASKSSPEIELIELSSDEDDDGLICVDVCRQFASSSLANHANRPRNNGHLLVKNEQR